MTREEFSDMLVRAKKSNGATLLDIAIALDVYENDVYRIERAKSSYSMGKVFKYLEAIKSAMIVSKEDSSFSIDDNENLVRWKKLVRGKYSMIALSYMIGCSKSYILNIESGRSIMSIDKFLKIAEVTGYSISIVDKNE